MGPSSLRGYGIWDGRRTTLRAANELQMSASSDSGARESIHIELLPTPSTDQPMSGITLAGATQLRQLRSGLEEAFELDEAPRALLSNEGERRLRGGCR
jgi:hypothetical protein